MDPSGYVAGLCENLKKIHDDVGTHLRSELAARQAKAERTMKSAHVFKVGDKVFLRRPPAALRTHEDVSSRLLPRADPQLYEVFKGLSPQSVVLCHPDTRETQLGFAQPITTARLIPFDLPLLEEPIDESRPLHIEILRDGQWHAAKLMSQSCTGAVRLLMEADGTEAVVNLEEEEYRFIYR